jgi:uncharacterized membrane protein
MRKNFKEWVMSISRSFAEYTFVGVVLGSIVSSLDEHTKIRVILGGIVATMGLLAINLFLTLKNKK